MVPEKAASSCVLDGADHCYTKSITQSQERCIRNVSRFVETDYRGARRRTTRDAGARLA
jgi:hypothetical protein